MKRVHIREEKDGYLCALCDGKLLRLLRIPKEPFAGTIALGKVKFVKKDVGIFVDIGLEKDGILEYRAGLKSGDSVLVRIETEPKPDRGCSLSEKITLAGKYVVLLDKKECKFSKEIEEEKRKELIPIFDDVGFLFRSLCLEANKEDIEGEERTLREMYLSILQKAKTTRAPAFLYREEGLRVAKNMAKEFDYDFREAEEETAALTERKVDIDGAELVFDKTEAMTVVDVNFHAARERGENAVFAVNKRAVEEFARQVRLRNLSGIIVLDYISMSIPEGRKLFELLKKELTEDYVRCQAEHAEKSGLFIVLRPERYSPL